MCVKNSMVAGKSLILAISLLLLNQCASHTVAVDSQSTYKSVETVYSSNMSSANYLANFFKYKFCNFLNLWEKLIFPSYIFPLRICL